MHEVLAFDQRAPYEEITPELLETSTSYDSVRTFSLWEWIVLCKAGSKNGMEHVFSNYSTMRRECASQRFITYSLSPFINHQINYSVCNNSKDPSCYSSGPKS